MKTIATPAAIAAGVEEASKDAVAAAIPLNQKCLSLCISVERWGSYAHAGDNLLKGAYE